MVSASNTDNSSSTEMECSTTIWNYQFASLTDSDIELIHNLNESAQDAAQDAMTITEWDSIEYFTRILSADSSTSLNVEKNVVREKIHELLTLVDGSYSSVAMSSATKMLLQQ